MRMPRIDKPRWAKLSPATEAWDSSVVAKGEDFNDLKQWAIYM
jgi:hypothetical protein